MQSYRVLSPRPAHVATALAHLPRLVEGLARLHVPSDAYLKRVLFREIFTAYIEKVLTTPLPPISSTFHPQPLLLFLEAHRQYGCSCKSCDSPGLVGTPDHVLAALTARAEAFGKVFEGASPGIDSVRSVFLVVLAPQYFSRVRFMF